MWESPVNFFEIHEPIVEEINKQTEETVFKAIHRVGIDVDKEELIKALQYDRGQYEKGYKDGYADAIDEFAEKIIVMMPGHRQDIEQVAEQLKGVQNGRFD